MGAKSRLAAGETLADLVENGAQQRSRGWVQHSATPTCKEINSTKTLNALK